MRIVPASTIKETVAGLFIDAVCNLPKDVLNAIEKAKIKETGAALMALEQILENERLANVSRRPCCQDTGLAIVFIDLGEQVHIDGSLTKAVNEGVAFAYERAYLRKSALSPLTRENTLTNTPAILHLRLVEGDKINISVMPKGFGSENMSALKMLKPSDGVEGVLDFIVETVKANAANACPPVIIGVGIGGTMEAAALLAKRQLLRETGKKSDSALLSELEQEALKRVNSLGIGPMGYGGKTTALACHIAELPTHIAGLPVALNMQCHCSRHKSAEI